MINRRSMGIESSLMAWTTKCFCRRVYSCRWRPKATRQHDRRERHEGELIVIENSLAQKYSIANAVDIIAVGGTRIAWPASTDFLTVRSRKSIRRN